MVRYLSPLGILLPHELSNELQRSEMSSLRAHRRQGLLLLHVPLPTVARRRLMGTSGAERESSDAYLERHGVEEAMMYAVARVVQDRPADPIASIGRVLLGQTLPADTPKNLEERMLDEIANMGGPSGFDYVIVCCSNLAAENYWQGRLERTVAEVTGAAAVVLCVHEDWEGGAGNGIGTLYAFQKACAKGAAAGMDVAAAMRAGAAVAIYHTAGKGTRMAPLPASENNNKPGVKLPALLHVKGEALPITVLECVMRQTSSYAAARKGRASVFWGDQVFVPSCGVAPSSAPADILAALRPMPSRAEWEAEQLHQYGLIAVDAAGGATQLEKVTYDVATAFLPPDVVSVGTSLGSFSVSAALMDALLAEFAAELAAKKGCLDSDPHWWMPLTLKQPDYVEVMGRKGVGAEAAAKHYGRMRAFKERFAASGPMLACIDVGQKAYWWDYGRLELYFQNNSLATQDSPSAHALRTFLRLHTPGAAASDTAARWQESSLGSTVAGPEAVLLKCSIGGGRIGRNCVLVNVSAPSVELDNVILVNVSSTVPIVGSGGLLYNVVHSAEDGVLEATAVRADVFSPGAGHLQLRSERGTDGGKAWNETVHGNPMSFDAVYKANAVLDVGECTEAAGAAHAAARAKLKAPA